MPETSLLFVCTGNICRSPTAEAVARGIVAAKGLEDRFRIDSAGTHGYHVGEPPDPRARALVEARGYSMDGQYARRVDARDFREFDNIFAMDSGHLAALERQRTKGASARLHLFLEYALGLRQDVPDPYYGANDAFDQAFGLIEQATERLIERLSSDRA